MNEGRKQEPKKKGRELSNLSKGGSVIFCNSYAVIAELSNIWVKVRIFLDLLSQDRLLTTNCSRTHSRGKQLTEVKEERI